MGIPLDIQKAKTNKYHYVAITPRPEASSLHKNQGRWDSSLAVDVAGVIVTFHRPRTDTGARGELHLALVSRRRRFKQFPN